MLLFTTHVLFLQTYGFYVNNTMCYKHMLLQHIMISCKNHSVLQTQVLVLQNMTLCINNHYLKFDLELITSMMYACISWNTV